MKRFWLLFLLIPFGLWAQEGFGGFGVTGVMLNLDEINERLTAVGVDPLDQWMIGMGGGGWGGKGVVLGGWGFGGTRTTASESLKVRAGFGAGFFEAGYSIRIFDFLWLKPLLGIGGCGYSLDLRPILGDVRFDSLLLNPARTSKVSLGGFVLAPALGITIPINFVGLSLKAGYIYQPVEGDWTLADGSAVTGGPSLLANGPYITAHIIFGGAGKVKAKGEFRFEFEGEKEEEE